MTERFLILARRLMPSITAVEAVVIVQVFAETIRSGRESVPLSHKDLSTYTGLSKITVSKAVKALATKKYLVAERTAGEKTTFSINWEKIEKLTEAVPQRKRRSA